MYKFINGLFSKTEESKVLPPIAKDFIFLDVEYISDCQMPVEIGLVMIDQRGPVKGLFEKINWGGLEINRHAHNKNKIPLSVISSSKVFSYTSQQIESLINEKVFVHWGGSDPTIIKKAFNKIGRELPKVKEVVDFMTECGGGKLIDTFLDHFPNKLKARLPEAHSAILDAFFLSFIFLKIKYKWSPSKDDWSNIEALIKQKDAEIFEFHKENKGERSSIKGKKDGVYSALELKVYFSGFGAARKVEIKTEYSNKGIAVVGSIDTHHDFLVIPKKDHSSIKVDRIKMESPQKVLTEVEFEKLLERKMGGQAS